VDAFSGVDMDVSIDRGRTLHREFVGMLFALAIAEVAVRSGVIANSDLPLWTKAPAVSHLLLAAVVIATSWVGWGWSQQSLSNVRHVFTGDFIELLTDVWLVAVYFFLVGAAETIAGGSSGRTAQGSVEGEAFWVMVVFLTYVFWDVWTKWGRWRILAQRGWASLSCAMAATVTFYVLRDLRGTAPVVLGDLSLLFLVLLFRAMKIRDFASHDKRTSALTVTVGTAWLAFAIWARTTLVP